MIIWKIVDTQYRVILIPIYSLGTNKDISLLLYPSIPIENGFLYTTSTFSGQISAKRSTDSTYLPIGEYSLTPSCFLGDLTSGENTEINFRINMSSTDFLGENVIPIYLGSGDNVVPLTDREGDKFWDNYSDTDTLMWWCNTDEVDTYGWGQASITPGTWTTGATGYGVYYGGAVVSGAMLYFYGGYRYSPD